MGKIKKAVDKENFVKLFPYEQAIATGKLGNKDFNFSDLPDDLLDFSEDKLRFALLKHFANNT